MNIKAAFQFIITEFEKQNIHFALIGGFALENAGVVRTTMDIDLLVLTDNKDIVKNVMETKGYQILHESEDVINYIGDQELGRIDILIAHRKYTLAMLARANITKVIDNKYNIKVVVPEDLIGLKVQAMANDPARLMKEAIDIQSILNANKKKLNMEQIREYFQLFEMEEQLNDMLRTID